MQLSRSFALTLATVLCAMPAQGADYSDPTWPCVQRKVENLSLGLMWAFPVDATLDEQDVATQQAITELADSLALRRVELDALRPLVAEFAETYGGNEQTLGLVFQRVFDGLSKRRTRIISGIGDFSLSQIALAEKIDAARLEMDTILDKEQPDFDQVDVLEERLDWDQLIYTDRQRSITYLCETPQILEKRLFSIAQMLQQHVRDQG